MIGAWLAILSLALVSFAIAAFTMRLPREGFAVFGAVLLFGLALYSWNGSPDLAGSPKEAVSDVDAETGEQMVAARTSLPYPSDVRPDYLVTSDSFARQGKFKEAADFVRIGLRDNPDHLESWLALAMALTSHADGVVTPASYHAYNQARAIDPAHPGADFFLGFSFYQTGEFRAARDTWARLIENSPEDAPWVPGLEQRVEQLDLMIANAPMLQ